MLSINNVHWHIATEEWAEGAYAPFVSALLVLVPLAWIAGAAWRGRATPQKA